VALKEFSEAILFAGQAAGNQVLVQIAHVHETPKLAFGSAPLPRRSALDPAGPTRVIGLISWPTSTLTSGLLLSGVAQDDH